MSRHNINECFACGLIHQHVDGGGMWHCPNPLCTGCGITNAIVRRCNKSVVSEHNGVYTIDDAEVRRVQAEMVREIRDDALLSFLHKRYEPFMRSLDGELPIPVEDRDCGDEHREAR